MTESLNGIIDINRYSWHGRLTRYVFGNDHIQDTPSICPYFWSVMACFIFAPLVWVGRKVDESGQGFRGFMVFVMVLFGLGIVYVPDKTIIFGIVITLVTAVGIMTFMALPWYEERHPYVQKKTPEEPPKKNPKQKSLFWEWLKARKDKVCPKIQEITE